MSKERALKLVKILGDCKHSADYVMCCAECAVEYVSGLECELLTEIDAKTFLLNNCVVDREKYNEVVAENLA